MIHEFAAWFKNEHKLIKFSIAVKNLQPYILDMKTLHNKPCTATNTHEKSTQNDVEWATSYLQTQTDFVTASATNLHLKHTQPLQQLQSIKKFWICPHFIYQIW